MKRWVKRWGLILLALLWASPASAFDRQNWFSTRGVRAFGQALTDGGLFGAPRYTTALLPTCDASNLGAFVYDTTDSVNKVCDGSSWDTVGGFTGGTVSGATVFTSTVAFGTALSAANSIDFNETAGCITAEGATDDGIETRICFGDITGVDLTINTPSGNAGGTKTLPLLESNQTWTATNTYSGQLRATHQNGIAFTGGTAFGGMAGASTLTPDGAFLYTGTTPNSIRLFEIGDVAFDFSNGPCLTAACTNPHLIVHDADQNITDYSSLSVGGVAGKMVKTLTEAAATDIAKVTIAAEEGTAGMLLVSVYATDGATPQVRHIRVNFAATNDGGTTTCTLEATPMEIDHTPTGTLTATVTCVDGTAAALLQVNATSSLTQTTLEARSQIILSGPGQIQPQ